MASTTTKVGNLKGPKGDTGSQGPAGPQGATGAAGAPGANGTRGVSVFSGTGAPSSAIISNAVAGQDSYIDLVSGDTYTFS